MQSLLGCIGFVGFRDRYVVLNDKLLVCYVMLLKHGKWLKTRFLETTKNKTQNLSLQTGKNAIGFSYPYGYELERVA